MHTLIINGHPAEECFCAKLAEAYHKGCQSVATDARILTLRNLDFNPNLTHGYSRTKVEPDLLKSQELIAAAQHLVFVYPTWWWTMPALLKGFIDRVFVPGFAFKYEENAALPIKLLKGKKATLIVTMDSPGWYYRWFMRSAGHLVMKKGVLDFCGITNTKIITIDNHRTLQPKQKEKWLKQVEQLAVKNG